MKNSYIIWNLNIRTAYNTENIKTSNYESNVSNKEDANYKRGTNRI